MQYVAFLRGMNVGGHRLKNPDLIAHFADLGFADPRAFLASGNVIFASDAAPDAVRDRLEAGLEARLGYAVPTCLRTGAEVIAVAAHAAFATRGTQGGKQQVIFLRDPPSAEQRSALAAFDTPADWLEVRGQTIYWWPTAGISTAELDPKALERVVGLITVRTRNTVERLVRKFLS